MMIGRILNDIKRKMRAIAAAAAALSLLAGANSAIFAQEPAPPRSKPDPNAIVEPAKPIENLLDKEPAPLFQDTLVPYAPAVETTQELQNALDQGALYLVAKLTEEGAPIPDGLIWRIYSEKTDGNGRLELIATSAGGDAEFRLEPGAYLIHTAFGYATATNRITIGKEVQSKTVILNAGGVKLDATLTEDTPLEKEITRFNVYGTEFDERGERNLIAADIVPGTIVRLNSGMFHVVSNYGEVNAVVRADVQVIPGKLTEATVFHQAADITLKLVNEPGGEAIANTSWTVLNPGGDLVVEATGAFPAFVLAAGEYEAIARNNGQNFSRKFEVVSGENREVELLAVNVTTQ